MRKHCSDCTFQWEDFSPVDFVNWNDGEPNDAGEGEDCVHFYGSNGKWNDAPCDRGWYYICEIYQDLDHKTELNGDQNWPSTGGCKEGWMLYAKGTVYFAKDKTRKYTIFSEKYLFDIPV